MNVPAFRHTVLASLVLGAALAAPIHVHAQDCGGGGGSSSGGDPSSNPFVNPGGDEGGNIGGDPFSGDAGLFTDMNNGGWDNLMTEWNFFAQDSGGGVSAAQLMDANSSGWSSDQLMNVSIAANLTVYAESPTPVSSVAYFNPGFSYSQSIEYINADDYAAGGAWTTSVDNPVYGGPYSRTINVTYPTPGTYYVRAGASDGTVQDWFYLWWYSQTLTVTVLDPITNYTVSIQTHPKPGMEKWVLPSNVVTKPFQVFHSN
jgi:hypothetical protein